MAHFIALPSGRIINAEQLTIIGPEVDQAGLGEVHPRLGRFVITAGDPDGWFLVKADADHLILALGVRDWTNP